MSEKITELLNQINRLEDELRIELTVREVKFFTSTSGVKGAKRSLRIKPVNDGKKRSLFKWTQFRNILSLPILYGLIAPMVFLDFCVSVYQLICFPLFKIQKSRRQDFISISRYKLTHLNFIEKTHCIYCEYINGLLAYVTDIASKTEQYFCPIKYANKVVGPHARYGHFQDFEDSKNFHNNLKAYRQALRSSEQFSNAIQSKDSPRATS